MTTKGSNDKLDLKAYCIFCKSGSEDSIVAQISNLGSGIRAIAPIRVVLEKRKGKWESTERPLIDGYVFIYIEDDKSIDYFRDLIGVYKVLEYESGDRELRGADYEYALWIYRHDGRIEPSKALTEGGQVKIIDGPLMSIEGKIIRIDKHKRRAWVEFQFNDTTQKVSLSVVDISAV